MKTQEIMNISFSLEEQVNTASSDIKVQEKRRVDLVYNLADCVKQYDKHEADTLTAIVDGRGSAGDIENVTTAITAVSEAYPELKSNENYKEQITARENEELKEWIERLLEYTELSKDDIKAACEKDRRMGEAMSWLSRFGGMFQGYI